MSGDCAGRVGIELEAFPSAPHHEVVGALAGIEHDLPGGSRVTFEPGGQVELSGPCAASWDQACAAMSDDFEAVSARVPLTLLGMQPGPERERVLDGARYAAMEAYFDNDGPAGRTMMRDTAALQVNVDGGDDARWQLVHALGPVLAAMFANSPVADGHRTGWRSNRLAVWAAIDPTRTRPVGGRGTGCWVDYAMRARVMFVRESADRYAPVDGRMTLAGWVESGHALGYPTADDVAYHLTTLFPPIRPRGWFELRILDALPSPWWQAAVAVCAAVLDDREAAAAAREACRGTESLWAAAAEFGVEHPVLGPAAEAVIQAALGVVEDTVVTDFAERYTLRRRCPADDALVPSWD